MSLKLDENNPKFPELFERTILRLWFGLNYRIIDRINVGLKNVTTHVLETNQRF